MHHGTKYLCTVLQRANITCICTSSRSSQASLCYSLVLEDEFYKGKEKKNVKLNQALK